MMKAVLISAVVVLAVANLLGAGGRRAFQRTTPAPVPPPPPAADANPYEGRTALVPENQIDVLVFARHKQSGIERANLCTDAVFLRRVHLDLIGTLPTAQEAREFLLDRSFNKRRALIDRLLEREEYADYWAMKWSDLLRVKAEFPINLWPNAAQAYHRWIRAGLRENKPYDQFVREMLTASGSNFRVPEVNFYRAVQGKEPQTIAQAVALTFMGMRAENWPKERLAGMSGFFSRIGYKSTLEWKEEIVFFDQSRPLMPAAVFPDGTAAKVAEDQDPRIVFADWLTGPNNPYFAKAIVNRAWSWLMGRGIIHEPDDIRPDNAASNPELLALLEQELIKSRYDTKRLYKLILNSRTYQLASIPKTKGAEAEANFAYYPLRRLEAEVLIDALNQITGANDKYSSAVPEPFTFIPDSMRSIALPDGSITSSFLEMFGRPPRDSGLESERNNRPTADQRLHLLNSSHIQKKIEFSTKLRNLMQSRSLSTREVIDTLYLSILSRFPTEDEVKIVMAYAPANNSKSREAMVDLTWALINSAEFLYRH